MKNQILLRFWHWFALADGPTPSCITCGRRYDPAVVQIREETAPQDGTEWVSLTSYIRSSGPFTYALVDISSYAGKKVPIGFFLDGTFSSGSGAGWYVDDVRIEVP